MNRILAIGLLCLNLMACGSEDAPKRTSDQNRAALLVRQASEHIPQGRYQAAIAPMADAIVLEPANTEYRLLHCLLLERTEAALAETKRCYADVVNLFSKEGPPCDQNMNCVIASLLAESDQAEATKRAFLAQPVPQAEAEMRQYVLEDFDRRSYLNAIFP